MINHTEISFHDDRLKEIQTLLDKLAPHEHGDGMNECAICDQELDEAILIELRRAVELLEPNAPQQGKAGLPPKSGVLEQEATKQGEAES